MSLLENRVETIPCRRKIMSKAIPEGYHSLTPNIAFKDARKAIDFYKKAFGAKEKFLMPGLNGKGVIHAELWIGNSIVMMTEEMPGSPGRSAESLGNSPIGLYLYVEDADAVFKKAVELGAKIQMQLQDMFWGDRMGQVKDPFG